MALSSPPCVRHLSRPFPSGPCRPTLALRAVAVALLGALSLAATAAGASHPARALAQKQGCLGCHASDTRLVGPAFQAVAERYQGRPQAAKEVAAHIRSGGSGRWGDIPMPPQTQLGEADAKRLTAWILSGAQ